MPAPRIQSQIFRLATPTAGQTSVVLLSGTSFRPGFSASLTTPSGAVSLPASATAYLSATQIAIGTEFPWNGGESYLTTLTITNVDGSTAATSFRVLASAPVDPLVSPSSIITTVAGGSRLLPEGLRPTDIPLGSPRGFALAPDGSLYLSLADYNSVVRIRNDGSVESVAGTGIPAVSGDGGLARLASLSDPRGLAVDRMGNLFIYDQSGTRVRRVDTQGYIWPYAGNGAVRSQGDGGAPTAASFALSPEGSGGLATDSAGNLYIADEVGARIRRVTPDGGISTFAGNGTRGFTGDDGPANRASLNEFQGLFVDAANNVYITAGYERTEGHRIRVVDPRGVIRTIAGTGRPGVAQDGMLAREASFDPRWLTADAQGNLLVVDGTSRLLQINREDQRIRILNAGADSAPLAGVTLATVRFSRLGGIASNSAGDLLLLDDGAARVRRVDALRNVSTAAGSGTRAPVLSSAFAPGSALVGQIRLAIDASGNVLLSEAGNHTIRQLGKDGVIRLVAGTGTEGLSGDGGPALAAQLSQPSGIAVGPNGTIFVADSGNSRIRRIQEGRIDTLYTLTPSGPIAHIAVDRAGNVFFSDTARHRIVKVTPDGASPVYAGTGQPGYSGDRGPALSAQFKEPAQLAIDAEGGLLVSDVGNASVRRISPAGAVSTALGLFGPTLDVSGLPDLNAFLFFKPAALAPAANGTLFVIGSSRSGVTDRHTLFRITPDGRAIKIFDAFGSTAPQIFEGCVNDGVEVIKNCVVADDMAVDAEGNLYVWNSATGRIRKILAAPPVFEGRSFPSELTLNGNARGLPQTTSLLAASTVPLTPYYASITQQGDWLSVTPDDGATPRVLTVSANPATLAPGEAPYEALVAVSMATATPRTRIAKIRFSVAPEAPPALLTDVESLSFSFTRGSAGRSERMRITNAGAGDLPFRIEITSISGGDWLAVSPTEGTARPGSPVLLDVRATPGANLLGTYRARVRVSGAGQTKTIPVTVSITPFRQILLLTQKGHSFRAVQNGGIVPSQRFGIVNLGSEDLAWQITVRYLNRPDGKDQKWLKVTPDRGVSSASGTIPEVEIEVDQTGLENPDAYSALLEVRGDPERVGNTPQLLPVYLELLPQGSDPPAVVEPTEMLFSAPFGQSPGAKEAFLYNISEIPKSFTVRGFSQDWIQLPAAPPDGVLDPRKRSRVLIQPLSIGQGPSSAYRGQVTFQFSDGRASVINIGYVVTNGSAQEPRLRAAEGECTQRELYPSLNLQNSFTSTAGWPAALEADLRDNCDQPVTDGEVTVQFTNGDKQVGMTSLRNGRWHGTWLTSRPDRNITITVIASRQVGETRITGRKEFRGALDQSRTRPVITKAAITNLSSTEGGQPLPVGGLIRIRGAGLAIGNETRGTDIFIGDQPAAVLALSAEEAIAQLPFTLRANLDQTLVLARRDGMASDALDVTIADAQPGIVYPRSGRQGDIRADGTLADSQAPVSPGTTVRIRCTGLGRLDPMVDAGEQDRESRPVYAVTVRFGEREVAPVGMSYRGGYYFLDVVVPEQADRGSESPVIVVVDTGQQKIESEPATMAIRP